MDNSHKDDDHYERDNDMQKAREEMREAAQRLGSPYIAVTVENEASGWDGVSPMAHIGLHFELLLNSLMLKYAYTEDDNYVSFLAYISTVIENFALLTSEFGLRQSGYDPTTGEKKSSTDDSVDYQIPDIFKKGLEDTDLNLN